MTAKNGLTPGPEFGEEADRLKTAPFAKRRKRERHPRKQLKKQKCPILRGRREGWGTCKNGNDSYFSFSICDYLPLIESSSMSKIRVEFGADVAAGAAAAVGEARTGYRVAISSRRA